MRLAGDEFAMVIPDDDLERLKALCEMIITEASKPSSHDRETLCASISVGLATTSHVGSPLSTTLDGLSRATDFALYATKAGGRNNFIIYDQSLENQYVARNAMLEELPRALDNEDLEVYLQPKVDLPEGTIYGFEALVRWNRDGHVVLPSDFISIAEQSGIVVDIDRFVLNKATAVLADWNKSQNANASVSVNLSALHFNSTRILEWIEVALERSQLDPRLLTLEITETVEMSDWEQAQFIISRMHALGCRVAIDDFGAGFSSLAYLRITSADELKIDRSLLIDVTTSEKVRIMLASVIELARNLEMDVTVEGIETEAQMDIVIKMGATQAQGYYFGRPQEANRALTSSVITTNQQFARLASRT